MIILTCGFCSCRELVPAEIHYEATCSDCLSPLSLWEMKMIYVDSTPELLIADELDAIGLNLAQMEEK